MPIYVDIEEKIEEKYLVMTVVSISHSKNSYDYIRQLKGYHSLCNITCCVHDSFDLLVQLHDRLPQS